MHKLDDSSNQPRPLVDDPRAAGIRTLRGRPLPLGVSSAIEGLNFALLCRHGIQVWLVIYPLDGDDRPFAEIRLHPRFNRTGDHWHVLVIGLPNGFRYGWRVDGPSGDGHRYEPARVLLDPATPMLSGSSVWGGTCEVDPLRTSRRSVFFRGPRYDWGDDAPPLVPLEDTIVYELHVRGFTCHPNSSVAKPGTFAGLIEKIPYLQWLGVTAVELLPIHEFDECDCPFENPATGQRNLDFWGYNTVAFAAPKAAYAASSGDYGQISEFRDMVKAFHNAGIEIWLDVVFNHTGEGDDRGRTFSFRGLDNSLYYLLTPDGRYLNFSGCGNTLNCNHPVVRSLLLTCLRYWVGEMHVDGLRFDLASILGRDTRGNVLVEPPIIEMIAEDGVLADTKLIAEPWDAAGLYQVGGFPFGRRWSEWNGRYRDDIRKFWKGDAGMIGYFATRLAGSSDLYEWNNRLPRHSVNYITCHDGFTLNDLVSYNTKHNEANGEENRDGWNDNNSWNCGVEGETDDPQVLGLRRRQAKNLMTTLLLSQGVPMLLAGDEFLRTQKGNNNAWCQDNEISWVDWSLKEKNADFLRFVRELIQLRKRHPSLRRKRFFRGEFLKRRTAQAPLLAFPITGPVRPGDAGLPDSPQEPAEIPKLEGLADIVWHGKEPRKPDWGVSSQVIAYSLDGRFNGREIDPDYAVDRDFYVAINGGMESVSFRIPASPTKRKWRRAVDTALASPLDIVAEDEGPHVADGSRYIVAGLAVVVLISEA
jgi:glycogen operon protein